MLVKLSIWDRKLRCVVYMFHWQFCSLHYFDSSCAEVHFSLLLAIVLFYFFFLCACHSWQSLFLFLGTSMDCVKNLKRTADFVLWFPDKTSVCTHPWHQVAVIVFTVPLNLIKLNINSVHLLFLCFCIIFEEFLN